MKLIEALEMVRREMPVGARPYRVSLVCGFTPAHFQTFLHAHLRQALPERRVIISAGLYGDFWGNLGRLEQENPEAGVVVMEWSDLDARLGLRGVGSWSPDALDDILRNARTRCAQLQEALQRIAGKIPLAVAFPTLSLPPASFAPRGLGNTFDLALRAEIAALSLIAARTVGVGVVNPQRLDELSPLAARFDAKSELQAGFPYKLPHASELAALLARLVQPAAPKKGLITDLDDTVWSGILGEVGVEGVSWDLEHHSHMHAVYQKLLQALSEAGVLLGVASKNDGKLVEEALLRSDMILPRKVLFPVEANWGPKSESIRKVLRSWNIGEDAVVFIDDSPMELAEVKAAHPQVECLLFPKEDPQAINELLYRVRDYFGKAALSEEDGIRRDSILRARDRETEIAGQGEVSEEFLKAAEAELTLNFAKAPRDARAFELVNKTNQFNLNGRRYTEKEWLDYTSEPAAVLLVVSYQDKYGPLGKIAVLAGRLEHRRLTVDVWVMSCRAFSRRIEERCLEELFERFELEEIIFNFVATPKNGPTQEFLKEILGTEFSAPYQLSRSRFNSNRRGTFQQVLEPTNG